MASLTLKSPAKLNLYLEVVNKRLDGYHNLVTLFERIDLCDELKFTANQDGRIRLFCSHSQVPLGPKNLIYKTARLLQEECGVSQGVDVHITKRIPVAAGLAGGSSNAATALLALNRLWKLKLSRERLVNYGKRIGADVAFFLYDASWALGTERGDRIEKLKIAPRLWHVLVVPQRRMYTRKVFENLKLPESAAEGRRGRTNMLTKDSDDVNILIRNLRNNKISVVGSLLRNDLEISVFQLCPKLEKLKEYIKRLNVFGVSLSGSGPSIFCLTDSQKQAEYLKSMLGKRYSRVFVVKTH